ncbi:MAG: hypothetical protein LUH07_05485 [Lachnospiraceae bacterium]|nr:hypothetical protein [Lachnospiraceae bacterium]
MFIRTVVEGVFGIHMNAPEKTVVMMPGLPTDWDHASIKTDAVSCQFTWQKNVETWHIESRDKLRMRMKLCLREKKVRNVCVNGETAAYTVKDGRLLLEIKDSRRADIEIFYETVSNEAIQEVMRNTAFKTISLDSAVNQNLSKLHQKTYTISFDGRDDYILPRFYFVKDTTRGVTANGRSWWEAGRGAEKDRYMPSLDRLPAGGGILQTDIGVPFAISDVEGRNAVFASLYHQFPERVTIPVREKGQRIYFLLCVSTNHMQAYVENAALEIKTDRGLKKLSLVNPLNIDDWLNYQTDAPYAFSGCIQPLGEKAHANILCVSMEEAGYIENVSLTCVANEVLAGLLGVTVGI